ncbi:AMP-binding protein, partial [Acinetobacter baumannii]
DLTVGQLLKERASEFPDRVALIGARHGSDTVERLTYAQLYQEADRVCAALSAETEPGDFVALWAPNVLEWTIIQYGAALAG